MLGKFRNFSKNFAARIFMGILVLIFASFGLSGISTPKDVILAIDGKSVVSIPEFLKAKQQLVRSIENNYPNVDLSHINIDQLVLKDLVKNELIGLEIERLGIIISNDIVIDHIKHTKMFHNKSGNFDKEIFKNILASNNIKESSYIKTIKRSIGESLLLKHMQGFDVPQQVVKQFYDYNNQKRVVDLFIINTSAGKSEDVSDQEVQVYYDINKNQFAEPEFREIEYLIINSAAFKNAKINLAEVNKEMADLNLSSEKAKEEFKKRIINNKIDQYMFESIKHIEDAISEGQSLQEVSKKFNLKYTKLPLIDANGFQKNKQLNNSMPASAKFLSEAFLLEENNASEVIASDNGKEYYIINVLSVKPMAIKPLNDIKNKILAELKQTKIRANSRKFASDVRESFVANAKDFNDKYKNNVLKKELTLSRPENDNDMHGISVNDIVDIFNMKKEGATNLLQMADGKFAFMKIKDIRNPNNSANDNIAKIKGQVSNFIDNLVAQEFILSLSNRYKVEVFEANIPKESQ